MAHPLPANASMSAGCIVWMTSTDQLSVGRRGRSALWLLLLERKGHLPLHLRRRRRPPLANARGRHLEHTLCTEHIAPPAPQKASEQRNAHHNNNGTPNGIQLVAKCSIASISPAPSGRHLSLPSRGCTLACNFFHWSAGSSHAAFQAPPGLPPMDINTCTTAADSGDSAGGMTVNRGAVSSPSATLASAAGSTSIETPLDVNAPPQERKREGPKGRV